MSIFKKFTDLVRANVNDWLDKVEDPLKLHEQKLLDAKEQKQKAQKLLVSAMARLRLYEDKMSALNKDSEALLGSTDHTEKEILQLLSTTIQDEKNYIEALKKAIKVLETNIKSMSMTTPIDTDIIEDISALQKWEQLEEDIDRNEAQAQALMELVDKIDLSKSANKKADDNNAGLEHELSELKKRLSSKND